MIAFTLFCVALTCVQGKLEDPLLHASFPCSLVQIRLVHVCAAGRTPLMGLC
jgi:hypothetical protein